MKKQKKIEQPLDPLFISKCHPYSTVDWREIVEDVNPSRTIAIVGRCHACMGVQRVLECAYNIDRNLLVGALHGNGNWLLDTEVVKSLRADPNKPHGELFDFQVPVRNRPGASVPVTPEERDFTEPKYRDNEEMGVW